MSIQRRPFVRLTAALLLLGVSAPCTAAERDSLECFQIRDTVRSRPVFGAELTDARAAGCRVRKRATLLCAPADARGEALNAGAGPVPQLVFDRLCYKIRCPDTLAAKRALSSSQLEVADLFGPRLLSAGAPTLVCTPATATTVAAQTPVDGARSVTGVTRASEVALLACGDFSGDGKISASDALSILRTATGLATCLPCVCDADGNTKFTASDALLVLKKAVLQPVDLKCQPDGNPVTWTGKGDGVSWHDPANWSTQTRVPNLCDDVAMNTIGITVVHSEGSNGVLRLTSASGLDLSGGTLQARDTVLVSALFRINGGTLKDAVVLAPGAGVTASGMASAFADPSFGSAFLSGSALDGIALASVTATTSGGVLDNVTMNDDLDLSATSSSIRIQNSLTLNGTAVMGNASSIRFQGGQQSLQGGGDIAFGTVGNKTIVVDSGTTVVIGPEITIRGGLGTVGTTGQITVAGIIDSDETGEIKIQSTEGWTNQGMIQGRNGGDLRLLGPWTNNGGISIADSGTLTLDGTWTNAGSIRSTSSTVNLDGTFTLASLGDFQRTGGEVNITGTLNNATDLLLDAETGSWSLRGGTILGGAVEGADGSKLIFTTGGGLLDGVTMNGQMDLSATSSSVRIQNSLTLNGTAVMGNASSIRFQGGQQTLQGGGDIAFGTVGNKTIVVDSGTTVAIGPEITIRGGLGTVGTTGQITVAGVIDSDETGEIKIQSTEGWTNQGTIQGRNGGDLRLLGPWTNNGSISIADSGTLILDGTWTNAGAITSTNSTVNLDGTFTLASLGDFQRTGGEVNITGTFNNATDLLLDAATGSWSLRGGTIVGGAVEGTAGSKLFFTTGGGLLDGVTMNGEMDLSATGSSVRVQNGLTLNGTAVMGNASAIRFLSGQQSLQGSGDVAFGAAGGKSITVDSGAILTIGPDITVRGGTGTVGSTGQITIAGLIDSDQTGEITIRSNEGWTNQGAIQGRNGGDLRFLGLWTNNGAVSIADSGTLTLDGTWTNAGTITSTNSTVNLDGTFTLASLGDFQRTGGEVNITGTLNNATDLLLDAATGSWSLRGGTIVGGAVEGTGGSKLIFTTGGGLLDGVTMNGEMDLSATSSSVRIQNGFTLSGTATMGNASSIRFQGGQQTLQGSGDIAFGTIGSKTIVVDSGTTLTVGPGILIHGGIGDVGSSGLLTVEGVVDSDQPGEIEITSVQGWTNEGTLRASVGDLGTGGTGTNAGTIELAAGRTLNARKGFVQSDAGTLSLDIGGLSSFGKVVVTGGAATIAGTLAVQLTNGFDPNLGDTFTVMTFSSRSGDFTSFTGLSLGGGKALQPTFTATALILEVVSQ